MYITSQLSRDLNSEQTECNTPLYIASLIDDPEAEGAPADTHALLRAMLNGSFDAMAVINIDRLDNTFVFLMQNASMTELRQNTHVALELDKALRSYSVIEQILHGATRVIVDAQGGRGEGVSGNLSYSFTPIERHETSLEPAQKQTAADSRVQNRIRLLLCIRDNMSRNENSTALQETHHHVPMLAGQTPMAMVEAELRTVMEGARCLVWHAGVRRVSTKFSWDMHVTHEGCSTSWLPIFVPEGSTFRQAWTTSIHPEDIPRMDARSETALLSGASTYSQEFRCILANGSLQWLREVVHITAVDKDEWMLVGICTDITEQKAAEISLSCERNQLRTLIDNLPSYIYFKDALGRFVIDNAAHARFLGADSPNDVIGHTIFDYIAAEEAEQSELEDLAILETGLPMLDKIQCVHDADGNANWYSTSKIPLCNASGSVIGLVGISHDITRQHQLEEERGRILDDAIDRADRDPLTGLLNHRQFHTRLAEIEAESVLLGGRYSVVIVDIDNFRFFNSAYGHPAGDEVLRNVASVIRSVCRGSDTLARLGSDEFALILQDAGPDDVVRFSARLEAAVNRTGYQPEDYEWEVPLSISSGTAAFPDDSDSRLGVLNVAGERLKTAKFGGSDSAHIVAHLRGGLSSAFENFSLLNALVSAVDNKDRYTRKHSEDVLRYSVQIATELGLDEQTMFHVKVAALIHDVGKIGVPDEILRKPGKLTDEEFGAIKQHPVMGAIMVHAVPGLEATLDAVRYHHERWDGNGYPDGLAGMDIPLLGRLMAVADAYSAMTTDRPYRKAMASERAEQILLKGAGTQWDPECVHAFLRSRGINTHDIG